MLRASAYPPTCRPRLDTPAKCVTRLHLPHLPPLVCPAAIGQQPACYFNPHHFILLLHRTSRRTNSSITSQTSPRPCAVERHVTHLHHCCSWSCSCSSRPAAVRRSKLDPGVHFFACMNPSRAADSSGSPEAATCSLFSQVPTLHHDARTRTIQSPPPQSPKVLDTSAAQAKSSASFQNIPNTRHRRDRLLALSY